MLWNQFKKSDDIQMVIDKIKSLNSRPIKIMEICGTHTMAIAKSGIKSLLPENIKLISGPGCPVCVTPVERIDEVLYLAENRDIVIATYGDMLKVPGSEYGKNLEKMRASGANVKIVYSPVDAVEIAERHPEKEVVFLGIGFETTTPGSGIAIEAAKEKKLENFSIFNMHKAVEPVLRELISMDDFDIDGFLCPGNVAVILGEQGFKFLIDEFNMPSVICGFEAGDIIYSVYRLLDMINNRTPKLENEYIRAVKPMGNEAAKAAIEKYFVPCDDLWRGMGMIKGSGLKIRYEYIKYDAREKFKINPKKTDNPELCMCGEIIKGKKEPYECSLFSNLCTPENPIGPCMVSSEGACAACYKYGHIEVRRWMK